MQTESLVAPEIVLHFAPYALLLLVLAAILFTMTGSPPKDWRQKAYERNLRSPEARAARDARRARAAQWGIGRA